MERTRLTAEEIQRVRADVARELGDYPRLGDIGETWLRLADAVIAPAERHLREGDLLILVPHGALHGLPLHGLRSEGRRVLERWPVTYLPTASALPYLVREPRPPKHPVVIGAYFVEEARAVARLLGAGENLLGLGPAGVDKGATLEALAHGDLVHVSAYGFFLPRAPDASGWVLRPGAEVDRYLRIRSTSTFGLDPSEVRRLAEDEEAIAEATVRAVDLAPLRLDARLVTLSACVSGLVGVDPADDPSGVVPMLLVRGAGGVLATLWLVDADVTATFMVEAYRHAAGDEMPWTRLPHAVRDAALAVMAEHPHPYFWAPFILTGALAPGAAREEKA
jgi:CHAT domain-containing protein